MQPLLLLYSETNADNISSRIGKSEYSYYFVLKWFAPALVTLGEIKVIHDPLTEADHAYDLAAQQGRPCVLFSFAPPHRTLMPQRCPIVPVVAWEFDRIPDYSWDGQPETDWRYNLKRAGCAITHSQFARQAILNAMGEDFPVWSIPAPVWDRFHARGLQYHGEQGRTPARGINLHVKGMLYDSADHIPNDPDEGLRQSRLNMDRPTPVQMTKWQRRATRWHKRLRKVTRLFKHDEATHTATVQAPPPPPQHLHAQGVVYASILNPSDARKNWCDIVTGFVAAFQNVEDAVLVLKLNELDSTNTFIHMTFMLRKFMWMKCKIYIFNGYLEDHDYDQFLDGIDYVVNFSTGEGQCLPLMELMSMGVPAISPDHTSMADYITPDNAYILPSFKTMASWPHDDRLALSTMSCQVSWEALRDAYTMSYKCAKDQRSLYKLMSCAAMKQLEEHCSFRTATSTLKHTLAFVRNNRPHLNINTHVETGMKTEDYIYNDDDKGIAQWMRNFTSRQGDGHGDPEETYLQMIEVMAACSSKNWLEIGCGLGRLIPSVSKFTQSYTGIEPDIHRYRECAKSHHSPDRGINILNFNSQDYRQRHPDIKHDVVIVSMVIQHVSTAVCTSILNDVESLLSDDGVAIISTTQTPIDLFTCQTGNSPLTLDAYNEYASNPRNQTFGLPVRKFSKNTFLEEIMHSDLDVVTWGQFSYIRPDKINWFANIYGVTPESLIDVGDSQYAIVKKRASIKS